MGRAYSKNDNGVTLHLRVTPNAGIDRIENFQMRDNDHEVLRVRVKAVPDKGKANTAVIALLAKFLNLPKSAITLTSGDTARQKTITILGDPAQLVALLKTLK